jgi:ferric-dicitrate binding protein FerR (iron transport regulator)
MDTHTCIMATSNNDDIVYRQGIRMAELIHKSREKEPLTEAEQQALNDWLNSNESNKALLASLLDKEQVAAEVDALLRYDENAAVAAIFGELQEKPPSVVKRRQHMIRQWSVAASIVSVIGITTWLFILRNKNGSLPGDDTLAYNTVTTAPGDQQHVTLPDGSEVWLNTASSIRYPRSFAGNTREVTIDGEAFFNVAKDKTKPFLVTAGAMKIEVMGTEFDVMAYQDENAIRTTLLEGQVKVSATGSGPRTPDSRLLTPGEQAVLLRNDGTLKIEKPNLDEITGWRNGQFSFHETDMEAILRQVARWYNVKLTYRGSVANIGFTGTIMRKQKLKELLAILSDTRKVHFEMKDDTTVVVIPGPR